MPARGVPFVVFGLLLIASEARAETPRLDGAVRLLAAGMLPPWAVGGQGGRAPVSVRVRGGAPTLRAFGFEAREAGPQSAYLDVAPGEIDRLAAVPGVRAIERVRVLSPSLDHSVPATFAPAVRKSHGLDGKNVLIGVLDTGIDFRHADFRAPAAPGDVADRTRVAALLDLSLQRGALHPEVPDFGKGALWLREDIDAQLAADATGQSPAVPVDEKDGNGHGTHVAGIAAGNGRATGAGLPAGRYAGVASGASLLVAKATRTGNSFSEEGIVTSLRFFLDRAAALGLPLVVNMSLGGDGGPHDGTLHLERAISDLFPEDAPGRAVVVAAGNGGGRDLHAGGLHLPDVSVEIRIAFPKNAPPDVALSIELWSDGPPPPLTLVDPDGTPHGPVAPGTRKDGGTSDPVGRVVVDNDTAGADPENRRHAATVYVVGNRGDAVRSGTWKLVLDGSGGAGENAGRWDAWLLGVRPGLGEPRFLDHLDPDHRSDFPSAARSAISVGAVVNRASWPTVDGRQITRGLVPGRASAFSGTGPTLDGRFLPDLAAPGEFILSALSESAPHTSPSSVFYYAPDPTLLVGDDGLHGALRGTSQAAPHVAGAIALLFQLDPTLTTRRLREVLRASATVDRGAPGFSPRSGFGRLDLARAVGVLTGRPAGPLDPATSTVGMSRDAVPPGERVRVSVVPRDPAGAPLGAGRRVEIASSCGRFEGDTADLGAGRYERLLVADAPRGSACTLAASVDGMALSQRPVLWVVFDRSEVGAPFSAKGGCAIARSPSASPLAPLAAALLSIRFYRRRRRP